MDLTSSPLTSTETGYIEVRQRLYRQLRKSENHLVAQNISEALREIKKALESLKEIRSFVVESNEPDFRYDLSTALQLQTKISRVSKNGMEDETDLLLEALDVAEHDEQLTVDIVKFAISNILVGEEDVELMPNSTKTKAEKVLHLVGLINSPFTQTLILIEVTNRAEGLFEVFPPLPELESLSLSQLHQLLKLLSRSREKDRLLCWVLEVPWLCEPEEQEKLLVQSLVLSAREASVQTSFLIFSQYIQLTIAEKSRRWRYVDVALSVCDKTILQLQGENDQHLLEKWLGGAALLASVLQRSSAFQHFAKHLLSTFLKKGEMDKLEKYLSSLNGKSAGMLKIEVLKDLHHGHTETAAPKVAELLRSGRLQSAEEVESLLASLLLQLLEADQLDTGLVAGMVDSLAEQQFYSSLPVFQLTLQLAGRLCVLDKFARRLYDDPELGWATGQDTEGRLATTCWLLAQTAATPLTKHFLILLAADLLHWQDPHKDQTVLASLTAGAEALKRANWSYKATIMTKLVDSVDSLEGKLDGVFRRFLLLFKFKMVLATERECKWDPLHVLADLIKTKDKVGLLVFSRLAAADSHYVDLNLSALCEALKLEDHVTNREMLAVSCLQQICEAPSSAKVWLVCSLVRGVTWTERTLLVEALKISWNIWVKVTSSGESSELCEIWFECMATLHNKLTEHCDQISCRLERPTSGLMRKIQRTIDGIY